MDKETEYQVKWGNVEYEGKRILNVWTFEHSNMKIQSKKNSKNNSKKIKKKNSKQRNQRKEIKKKD